MSKIDPPEHLSATLTGCESSDGYLEPAAVKEDADDQLSEIASTIPPVDSNCVDLKHSAFLAKLLLEEVDLSQPQNPLPLLGNRCPDALARPASTDLEILHLV